ncbi:MAG: hypothetical protein A2Z05_00305 [Chloroflexi bacterium RBG_16_60_22]|nr:MAG: hypothetical protein A2Z05_00305 [Chloroflexi bacterium RBG_16_60_22]
MKKIGIIGLILLVTGLLVVVLAVPALAHPFDRDYGTNGNGIFLDSPALTRLAEALGLTPDELASRLQEGEILAQIAREQGIPEEELVEAIVSPHADQIALRVKYGYLTESQAETLLETARERATWLLEQDLSGQSGYASWEEMQEYCGNAMGGWGGMMGGQYGSGNGWGGMMGGWNSNGYQGSDSGNARDFGGMMRGFGGGWGGTGGGMMGGW